MTTIIQATKRRIMEVTELIDKAQWNERNVEDVKAKWGADSAVYELAKQLADTTADTARDAYYSLRLIIINQSYIVN